MEWSPVFINLISFLYCSDCVAGATSITNVTLVDGLTPNEGRVEYLRSEASSRTSACGDGLSSQEASVICRQLGFPGVNSFVNRWPIGTSTSIAQHQLNCDGDEETLADCTLLSTSFCSNAGGVICYDTGYIGCYPYPTRALVDIQTPCEYGLDDSPGLTIPNCISFCKHTNDTYAYAGLYQGNMCLCGNPSTTISQADRVADRLCSSTCAGRNIERCGGDSHIALFNISSYLRATSIQPSSLVCKGRPISTTSLPEAPTTLDVSTTVATSHPSTIATSFSTSSASSSSSSSTLPSLSSTLPSSPSWPLSSSSSSPSSPSSSSSSSSSLSSSSSPSSSSSSSSPSSSSPSSSSLSSPPLATSTPSVIEMIPSTTNQHSSSTSEQVLSSSSGSSSSIMTSDGTKSSEKALSIALGVTAFLFLCAIVIFYIILRRRISQRYETNVAHMNYSGAADNSFFVSRLSRQDLIPPELNNGEVNPRESVHVDGTPRDGGIVLNNSSDQFNSRWSALGPRQQHPPLPDPYSSESINMQRSARDSVADRSSSAFASGTSQQDPVTSDSNGESRDRESFYINREARDSVYENDDEISDPGDHTYERIILNKIPGNQDQSTV